MSTIVTRAGKGSALTHTEMDANVSNLNTDKLESSNLKTINGSSIIGSGDLTVSGSDVAASTYVYSNNNQYGKKTNSPGFNVGKFFTSGPHATGSFNSGSFQTGLNTSGYIHTVIAVRTS